jgi:type IV secretory pathway component VirB8
MKLFEKKKPALATGENEVLKKKEKPISPKEAAYDFINASKEFEKSRVETIENSKKVAWIVAAVSVAITALLAVAIMVMMPLKKTEPYLVRLIIILVQLILLLF